jgi:hypothetical protein
VYAVGFVFLIKSDKNAEKSEDAISVFFITHLSAVSKYYPTSRAIRAIAHFNDDVFRLVIKNKYATQISITSREDTVALYKSSCGY